MAEMDSKAYADKARRTVDELMNEARSRGDDSSGVLRDILNEKSSELGSLLESGKGAAQSMGQKVSDTVGGITGKFK